MTIRDMHSYAFNCDRHTAGKRCDATLAATATDIDAALLLAEENGWVHHSNLDFCCEACAIEAGVYEEER
jgi:hypothetical protein